MAVIIFGRFAVPAKIDFQTPLTSVCITFHITMSCHLPPTYAAIQHLVKYIFFNRAFPAWMLMLLYPLLIFHSDPCCLFRYFRQDQCFMNIFLNNPLLFRFINAGAFIPCCQRTFSLYQLSRICPAPDNSLYSAFIPAFKTVSLLKINISGLLINRRRIDSLEIQLICNCGISFCLNKFLLNYIYLFNYLFISS